MDFTIISQLLAMDASARVTMKDAAKCDKRREWQNSENQENAERILHFQVIPGSMSTSGRLRLNASKSFTKHSCEVAWGMRRCVSVFRTSVPLTYEIQDFFKSKLSLRLVLFQQFGGKLIWFARIVKASRE